MKRIQTKTWWTKAERALRAGAFMLISAVILTTAGFASANVGENLGNWVLDQLVWIVIIVTFVGAITLFFRKNYTMLFVTIIGGGVLAFLVSDPTRILSIGEAVGSLVFA